MEKIKIYFRNKMSFKVVNQYIKVPLVLWIVVGIVFFVLLCLNSYNDILVTAKQAIHFWDLFLEGRPLDFYMDARMTTGSPYYPLEQGAAYLFPVYFVFSVWNFPIWIISRIVGFSVYNTIPAMIWAKLMLVPFVILSTKYIFRIVSKTDDKKKYAYVAAFLFASSAVVTVPTALLGQYDIITTYLILRGFDAWLDENKKGFVLSFAVAMFFKYFALLYFVPLLLLGEKKIRKIILNMIAVVLPIIPFMLIFEKPKSSLVVRYMPQFFDGLQIENTALYLFPLVAGFILIACFFTRAEKKKDRFRYSVFYLFLLMGGFCVLIVPHPYWTILAVPSFVLLCFTTDNMNKTVLLETALGLGITVKNYVFYAPIYSIDTTGSMGILHRLLGKPAPDPDRSLSLFYMFMGSDVVSGLLFTTLFGILCVMIYFARPGAKKESLLEPFSLATVYARTAANIAFALLPTAYLAAITLLRG